MTIDERLEALAIHLEVLSRVHQDFEKRTDERFETLIRVHQDFERRFETLTHAHEDFKSKMTAYAADVKDAIKRLANIAEAHDGTLDDHESRIKDLES
jgi:hypothetical protein